MGDFFRDEVDITILKITDVDGKDSQENDAARCDVNKHVNGDIFLDDGSSVNFHEEFGRLNHPRWMTPSHYVDKCNSMILIAGESFEFVDEYKIMKDSVLFVKMGAGLDKISSDGLIAEITFNTGNGKPMTIVSLNIAGGHQSMIWRELELDISYLLGHQGKFGARCGAGPDGDPCSDWLAISEFCVARKDRLNLARSRSFNDERAKNELRHFSQVYRHSMYSRVQEKLSTEAGGQLRHVRKFSEILPLGDSSRNKTTVFFDPVDGESPYGYASRLLTANIAQPRIDFTARIREKTRNGRKIKVLSLCSGAARIEAELSKEVGDKVEWSLMDINADLLRMASMEFPPDVSLDLVEGDVSMLQPTGEKWDVILCVSGLHHIVELERVVSFCSRSLNEGGEFWSLGEYVGRNGNQLWPDARADANKIFANLPDKYRLNKETGFFDQELPINDYSVGCFEGIRSEDIEPVLERWFKPLEVYLRNCFLWRLINLTYSDNYNLGKEEDRLWIKKLVEAEVEHYLNGGRCTELFGIYVKKE